MAVCVTDFVQGTLMLIGLLIVPLVAYLTLSGSLSDLLTQSGAPGGAAAFLNPFENGERPYTFVEIFSQLAWGLGYCGMPHILTRFMAVKSEKELKIQCDRNRVGYPFSDSSVLYRYYRSCISASDCTW